MKLSKLWSYLDMSAVVEIRVHNDLKIIVFNEVVSFGTGEHENLL